jgi:hypothetical protein
MYRSVKYLELQKEEKYPKSASLHQSLFLISMATEQQKWIRENSCKDWLVGIKFVQFQKNLSYHSRN